jgi:3-phosphoglycerate kinase
MKSLEDVTLNDRKVIVRVGIDVPMSEGKNPKILDDTRLKAILPTLHYLLNRNAKVILVGHLGRPHGEKTTELSLRPVYLRLSALLKKPIKFAPNHFSEATKKAVDSLVEGEILGLENIRFDKGEENNSRTFARKLANYGDLYVNDAFSASHREAASIEAITEFLPSYPGLLLEREVEVLRNLLRHPARPFVAIIGGAKVSDKLPTISQLLHKADKILLAGGVANTFLAANGMDVKKSLIDTELIEKSKQLLKRGRGKIVLPTDYVWGDDKILDIGDHTIQLFLSQIKRAHTVFWNGSLGKNEDEEFRHGSDVIAMALADSAATTVVGGGNTIEVLSELHLLNKVSFVTTAGGAALEMLAGKTLPGIKALH